jgi:hypothetical protein
LHFVQFWLDVIAEWEQENGKVLVDLAVNKDVQDAILRDPVRSKVVDIIDIEQWFYHNKGEYAPQGGVNMAQRQYMRKIRTGSVRFEDVYRAVSEYRQQYPDKAVVYAAQKYPELGWASLMAGGSCAAVPIRDEAFLKSIATMLPVRQEGAYLLKGDDGWLCYKDDDAILNLDLEGKRCVVYRVDTTTGALTRWKEVKNSFAISGKGAYWVRRK